MDNEDQIQAAAEASMELGYKAIPTEIRRHHRHGPYDDRMLRPQDDLPGESCFALSD